MIEIVQAGQADKTSLLFDMHRLRARVFRDMLRWDVKVNTDGLEVDEFDMPETIYLLALNEQGRVIGSWRLLPTTGPTMIANVWPQFMVSLPMPDDPDVWEVSRFAIHSPDPNPKEAERQTQEALGKMFCALTELCLMTGIREIYTLYDARIAQVIRRIDCHPDRTSAVLPINGMVCQTGCFVTDRAMLDRLRKATGVQREMLAGLTLPPALRARLEAMQRRVGHAG